MSINNGTCESSKTSVTATINNPPAAPAATGNSACGSSAITLNASGGTTGQYRWYTSGGVLIAGQTNTSYLTPVVTTTTTYSVSINNGTCESSKTSVTATINTPPAAPAATGNSACGSSAVTLNASGGTAGQYRWYTSGGVLIAGQTNSSYLTPVVTTATNYSVSINNGTCESSKTSVTATINTPPAPPTTIGASACSESSLTLTAGGGVNGQYRWYTSDGTAIAGEVNNSYNTPVISATTVYYVSINNGNCESTKTPVLAQIISLSSVPSTTGSSSCGPSAITLTASDATDGQYRWYTVSSGGTAISGEFNSTYTTPVINATTTYYVSINNGTCESGRNSVIAQVNTPPAAPVATGASGCAGTTVALQASGGNPGQYTWYTSSTGGTSIAGETNSTYTTPVLSSTTTYYVSIDNGTCESSRTTAIAAITACSNEPPAISTATSETIPGGSVIIDLRLHISDPDNNLDFSTLKILIQPLSGASASIDANYNLILDYQGLTFSGTDKLTIEICDLDKACSQQEFFVDVEGNIFVYNGISPNGDGKNDAWIIQNIDALNDTKVNHVSIFDRWGDSVFEIDNYDNVNRVFIGLNKNGNEVAAGTYFYKIEFKSGRKIDTGYFSLKR